MILYSSSIKWIELDGISLIKWILLRKLPLIYKGDMKILEELINILISENKPFKNFIYNYFLKNKRIYLVNEDLIIQNIYSLID